MAATNMACQQCCITNHMTGYNTYTNALLMCACGATGGCATACAQSACKMPPSNPMMGDACDTCINNAVQAADGGAGACDQALQTACQGDTDCVALIQCIQPCPAM
jgi:hypothetical protein